MSTSLEELASAAATCTRCRLSNGRTQVVFGVGDPHAEVMFIGEGPGYYEDKQGEPFVGAPGSSSRDCWERSVFAVRTCTSRTWFAAARRGTATRCRTRSQPAGRSWTGPWRTSA